MAAIKLTYIGGGSSRAAGTCAAIIQQGSNFTGSEVALVDLDPERLKIVQQIAERMAAVEGVDITFTTTTDQREGLRDADAVLSSFRPGNFEARVHDEQIPLKHGVIGQETQGPGGFFMALRSIHAMKGIVADMEAVCPNAFILNYTNPVNIVADAVSHHTDIPIISLCEGPIFFSQEVVEIAGLDPDRLDAVMIGLNHQCWSVRHLYDGKDVIPLIQEAYEAKRHDPKMERSELRLLQLASMMGSLPAYYYEYYYFKDEVLAELQAKPTTRAQDILAEVPSYWRHYAEQAAATKPELNPALSRGGLLELELAIDVLDAVVNDRKEVWPVNVPNRGAIADFPDDLVVEVPGFIDKHGVVPIAQGHMPRHLMGLLSQLGEYQALASEAAWSGTRTDAIRALLANPLVPSLPIAETIYDELAAALRPLLPERLLD